MSEIHYALRGLSRNPGFAAVAILTLALGIGANTVIFTIFHGVLLRPLDFHNPGQLIAVQESSSSLAKIGPELPVNALHFGEWRANNRTLEGIGMVDGMAMTLVGDGAPLGVQGGRISPSV